jgi:acyl carrier protein
MSTEEPTGETWEKFKAAAIDVLQVPAEKVILTASFADNLKADSLDLVEFVMALEETLKVIIEETELEGIETVAQAYQLVLDKLSAEERRSDEPPESQDPDQDDGGGPKVPRSPRPAAGPTAAAVEEPVNSDQPNQDLPVVLPQAASV